MNGIKVCVAVCMALASMVRAEAGGGKAIVVRAFVDQEVIVPCVPLGVAVVVRNESAGVIERVGFDSVSIRIRKEGDMSWKPYTACGVQVTPSPPKQVRVLAGQAWEDICMIHVNIRMEPVFEGPGVYEVQAGTPFGASEVIRVKVEVPEASAGVVEALRNKRVYMLFDEYTAGCVLQPGGCETAGELLGDLQEVGRMPESGPYWAWLVIGEFVARNAMIGCRPESERATAFDGLIAEYKERLPKLPPLQRDRLMVCMASAMMGQGKKDAAIELLRKVGVAPANEYIRANAQYLMDLYGRR